MGAVKPARVSTRSFSEDAIAGLYEALGGQSADLGPAERMVWEDADARFIFLITDAGALPAGDPQSKYPGVDLAAIHADATGKDVTIFPIHLISKEAQARNNVGPATEQYRLLAMDQGQTNNYKSVAADDVEMYDKIIREAIGEVITTDEAERRGVEYDKRGFSTCARMHARTAHLHAHAHVLEAAGGVEASGGCCE